MRSFSGYLSKRFGRVSKTIKNKTAIVGLVECLIKADMPRYVMTQHLPDSSEYRGILRASQFSDYWPLLMLQHLAAVKRSECGRMVAIKKNAAHTLSNTNRGRERTYVRWCVRAFATDSRAIVCIII